MPIQALETRWKGFRFRSRLEARWSVFFHTLKLDWYYEPQGFRLSQKMFYLPDYYVVEPAWWFEIKPYEPQGFDRTKLLTFGLNTPKINGKQPEFAILIGDPYVDNDSSYKTYIPELRGSDMVLQHVAWYWLECLLCHKLLFTNLSITQDKRYVYTCTACQKRLQTGEVTKRAVATDPRLTPKLQLAYVKARSERFGT